MQKSIERVIGIFRNDLEKLFRNRVIDIIIYGSVISGGFNSGTSDIDFIVIIEDALSSEDINTIKKLHIQYRQNSNLERLLEGRYAGLQNDKFINGYYVGTDQKGWRPIDRLGFDNIESAMILDDYESLYKKQIITKLLHFTWVSIENEIRNQIDGFIYNDLLGVNETYTNYALVTASRSLYTFLYRKFISKVDAVEWIGDKYFEMDYNNPKYFLSKIKEMVIEPTYIISKELMSLIMESVLKVKEIFQQVSFEEYIVISHLNNCIMLRFSNTDISDLSLSELSYRENEIRKIVAPNFLANFIGNDYKCFGLRIDSLEETLLRANEELINSNFTFHPIYSENITKDTERIKTKYGKDISVWEYQIHDSNIDVLYFSDDDIAQNISGISFTPIRFNESYKGIIKSELQAIAEGVSLVEILLRYQTDII